MEASKAGPAIEILVEAHDSGDAMPLHGGYMHSVSSRQRGRIVQDLTRAKDIGFLDREAFVDDVKYELNCRRDCVAAVDRRIAKQDLLQHFSVSHDSLGAFAIRF